MSNSRQKATRKFKGSLIFDYLLLLYNHPLLFQGALE